MRNLKLLPNLVIAVGIVFAISGVIAIGGGILINSFVGDQLASQNIVTPGDASIPNTRVTDIATALSMAEIIQQHAARITGGLTYAEMGRFAVPSGDPAGTSNPEEALQNDNGNPVPNSARDTQLTAASLVTSLSLSAMAFGIAYGVIALGIAFVLLGIAIAGLGYALRGLVTPEMAQRYGLKQVTSR
jgi:ABC-type antimicrobial peptide transport system permease subunit